MRTIDIHAHLTPQRFQRVVLNGKAWHGMTSAEGEIFNPRNAWTPQQRIADMDSLGMDVQVVSTNDAFYKYDQEAEIATAIARECNDEVAEMTNEYPDRLSGLANVPMQDVNAAIAEMERAITELGLKGVMLDDHVNGVTFDDPRFHPFWNAAEELNEQSTCG